jgi:hypothetical protein
MMKSRLGWIMEMALSEMQELSAQACDLSTGAALAGQAGGGHIGLNGFGVRDGG